jgi:transposase
MKHFLGMDIGKESIKCALVDDEGEVLKTSPFANDLAGFADLLAWLDCPQETLAVCEPTGAYGKRLKQSLANAIGGLHEINSAVLKRCSFSQIETKTDEADARSIAQAARVLHKTNQKVLKNTRVSCDLDRESLALWLNEYDRLRKSIVVLRQQLDNLDQHIAPVTARIRKRRQQELKALLKSQAEARQQIICCYERTNDRQAQLIDSVPGIGALSTAALTAVIGDIDRFASADALKGFLGVYARRNQTGKREGKSRMAKHGNKLVKHMLWNAAKAAVRVKHPANPFRTLYDRLIAKGKCATAAYGAVCRKLVQVIYGVLKSQTPFQFPVPTS